MAQYKLTYFDLPGRAEPIRLIFALAKVPFEDVRVKGEDWPALKGTTPWGQLPLLEVDGKTISQSITIARFLARRFNLVGSNEFEAAKVDELIDSGSDYSNEFMVKFVLEKDEAKKQAQKKNLVENIIPKYFGKLNKIQAENGGNFLVGKSATWADVSIVNTLEGTEKVLGADVLQPYPNLKKLKESVLAIPQIKEYVAKR